MITLKEQEIYRIVQTKDPQIAMLEGYGIKKKVKMFTEKNPYYLNMDFTINDYDKEVYTETTRLMVKKLLLNRYGQKEIFRTNKKINKLAETYYKTPFYKILTENTTKQIRRLLEDGSGGSSGTTFKFLNDMMKKFLTWAETKKLNNFGPDQIKKVQEFLATKEEDSDAKKLGKMVTGWIAIISAVAGGALLAKFLVQLFLKAVKGGINALKKFFGIFSSKTKIPLENPQQT
jgi:hypothetical protein